MVLLTDFINYSSQIKISQALLDQKFQHAMFQKDMDFLFPLRKAKKIVKVKHQTSGISLFTDFEFFMSQQKIVFQSESN